MLNLPSPPTPPKRKPRGSRALETKRGHCRRCGILPESRGAALCNDCAAHTPLISYHQAMGAARYTLRWRADFQLAGDDHGHSRYVCVECRGPKGYHGKFCRSCASRSNRGNPRTTTHAEEPLQ